MQGWIKLHRQLTEWEWYTDPKTFKLWIHLLITANIIPDKKLLGYTLQPGQLLTTLPRLAAETGLTEREVRTALQRFLKGGEISQITTNKFRVITIEKWAFYQGFYVECDRQTTGKRQANDSQMPDNRQADDRQTTGVNKEYKELEKQSTFTHLFTHARADEQPEGILTAAQRKLYWETVNAGDREKALLLLDQFDEENGDSSRAHARA